MATMDLAAMREFVRGHLDSDSEELPDLVIDRFFQDGSNRIENYSRTWAFRAVEYTLTTVESTQSYDLDTTTTLIDPAPLRKITDVRGPTYSLTPRDHRAMRERNSSTSSSVGNPKVWTVWGRTLYLWPTPSEAVAYTLTGYRGIVDWIATNSAPDFPEEFHELIAWWGLNRSYAMLDDPEMATFYREEFASELRGRAKHHTNAQTGAPLVMGGGEGLSVHRNELAPLRWPVMDV